MSIETRAVSNATPSAPLKRELDTRRLRESCREFESFLTQHLLKSMSDSIMRAENPDQAREAYEAMFRETMAGELSRHTAGGVADLLYHQLSPLISDTPQTDAPPAEAPAPVK